MAGTQDRDWKQKPCLLASSKVHAYLAFMRSLDHLLREWQAHNMLCPLSFLNSQDNSLLHTSQQTNIDWAIPQRRHLPQVISRLC